MANVKLTYEEQLDAMKRFIDEGDDFLVVSHVNPDGDAISSTTAVGWLLSSLGKSYTMMNEDACPQKFQFLWRAADIKRASDADGKKKYRYVIAVDCADYQRFGEVSACFADDVRIANIDHHQTNDHYGDVQLIRPDAAATAEILYDLLNRFSITWTEEIATCIYTGLLTDTGGFRFSNTSPRVMNIASQLLSCGVKANELAEQLLERMTKAHVKLLQRALSTLTFNADETVCWLSVSLADMREANAKNEDLEGLVQYPRNIEGVDVGILFKEVRQDVYKVSLRSGGRADVSEIAQRFGGGGHARAAGCTVEGKLEDIIRAVVAEAEKGLKANDSI
jgi:phosphoesterase RecJ-like protein